MKLQLSQPLTRVPGGSELLIHYKTKRKMDIKYHMPPSRDFLSILSGQNVADLPRLVPRICGTCSVSHRIAAVKAIEMVNDVTLPSLAELLRELAILGEVIRSHAYSVFFCTFPDLLSLSETISGHDLFGKSEIQRRLLSQGSSILIQSQEMVEKVAGCANLGTTIVPGGVLRNMTSEESRCIRESLHLGLSGIEWAKNLYKSLLSEVSDDIVFFEVESPSYISCFDTERNRFSSTATVSVINSDGVASSFPAWESFDNLTSRANSQSPTNSVYMLTENPDRPLLAGPSARLASLQNASGQSNRPTEGISNMFYAGLLRLDEMEFCTIRALSLLDGEWTPDGELLTPWEPREGVGSGCVESARGVLLYRVDVGMQGVVKDIDICTPTELNAGAMAEALKKVTTECSKLGWSKERTINYAKMVIRCFDPCVPCATHSKRKRHSSRT
jgi:coenzyme F420-reducing hydrogenase alpha subunit